MKNCLLFVLVLCLFMFSALAETPVTDGEISIPCQSQLSFNTMFEIMSQYQNCSVESMASMFDDAIIPYRGSMRVHLNGGEIEIGRIGNYFGIVEIAYYGTEMPIDLPWNMSIDTVPAEYIFELKQHCFSDRDTCESTDACLFNTYEIMDSYSYTVIVTGPLEDTMVSFVYRVLIHENSIESITLKLIDGEYTVDGSTCNANTANRFSFCC